MTVVPLIVSMDSTPIEMIRAIPSCFLSKRRRSSALLNPCRRAILQLTARLASDRVPRIAATAAKSLECQRLAGEEPRRLRVPIDVAVRRQSGRNLRDRRERVRRHIVAEKNLTADDRAVDTHVVAEFDDVRPVETTL